MQYRKLGNTGYDASVLGFGTMRLPQNSKNPEDINVPEAIKMIRTAIDNGVNYVDTAFFYHEGLSEGVVGQALQDGYRKKVKVATKMPSFAVNEEGDFDKFLDESLKRLQTDHIDFYLMHTLTDKYWEDVILKYDFLSKAEKAKKDGKIGHIGFSFHDKAPIFKKIVDGYDKWEFCLMQLNYLNETHQQGLEGLLYAAEKGIGIVIMEPLLGGKLANPPKPVNDIFKAQNETRTPVEWALDYLWNMPQVTTILSGMSTMEQVVENLEYANRAKVGMLSQAETNTIKAVQAKFEEIKAIPCTKCNYCMPCPHGVDIPSNFEVYNSKFTYEAEFFVPMKYAALSKENASADNCIKCKVCESKCPQSIEISNALAKVHEELKQQ